MPSSAGSGGGSVFRRLLQVSAWPKEEAAPEDVQACARFTLAYFEAEEETL
jgi:hypothetical protein